MTENSQGIKTENLTPKSKRTPISSLYVLKALCAFGVVSLHSPFGLASDYVHILAWIAVPVFFMVTGYFLYTEDSDVFVKRCWKTIKKVALLIVVLNLLLAPLSPIEGSVFDHYMLYFKWIFMGQTNGFGHLWYLTALLEGIAVMALVVLLFKKKGIGLLKYFALFYLVRVANGDYRELLFGLPESMMNANFISFALPNIAMGMIIREKEELLLKFKSWGTVYFVSLILSYLGAFILSSYSIRLWMLCRPWLTLVMFISVFLWSLSYKSYGTGSPLAYIGDKMSGSIYYFHGFFVFVWMKWLSAAYDYPDWGFVYVLIPTVLLAYIITKVQEKFRVHIF